MPIHRKYSNSLVYRRLLGEVRPFWRHIIGLFALSLLTTPLTLLNPIPLKLAVDSILGPHDLPRALGALLPRGASHKGIAAIALVATLFVLIALIKQLSDLLFSILRTYTGEKLVLAFRAKLFRHVQSLSLSYHDQQGTADSIYRIQYDAPAIQWIALDTVIPLITAVATLIAMIAVIARLDWTLAVVAMAVTPLLFFLSQSYNRRLSLRWREAKDVESSTLGVVQEVLSSVRVVKAFAQEDREQQRYVEHAGRSLRQQMKITVTGGMQAALAGMTMAAGIAIVLFLGALHVQARIITLGEFILVMSYIGMLYTPLRTFITSAASLQGSLIGMERALEILDKAPEVVEKADARRLVRASGGVIFDDVWFSYNPDRPALRRVSFQVAPGARVGIAGTTGAGKSTLVSLLLRLYDPTSGRILLDGMDLRDFRLRDLRNQFAIVLQEPVLFSTSIAENIAYGKPEATEEEIIAAAHSANAHDFIERLPQGYETEVGERGASLSGGERQRLSLARAFLKDAPILILDEPTSSVDIRTEALILDAMERLMTGRTTFMIAHRLSTLDICDVRLHLEHGELVSMVTTPVGSEPELDGFPVA